MVRNWIDQQTVTLEPSIDIVGAGDSCMVSIVASLYRGVEPVKAAFVGVLPASH